jgi:hypothetical protein
MAATYRQEHPGVSPSRAGRGRQRVLRCGATLSGLAVAAALVAACGSSGGEHGEFRRRREQREQRERGGCERRRLDPVESSVPWVG